jgi:hypothetical protein
VTHIHRFTIVKIYLVVGLSLLLLTGSFYFFGLVFFGVPLKGVL